MVQPFRGTEASRAGADDEDINGSATVSFGFNRQQLVWEGLHLADAGRRDSRRLAAAAHGDGAWTDGEVERGGDEGGFDAGIGYKKHRQGRRKKRLKRRYEIGDSPSFGTWRLPHAPSTVPNQPYTGASSLHIAALIVPVGPCQAPSSRAQIPSRKYPGRSAYSHPGTARPPFIHPTIP
jgi:hypothetical protein